MNDRINIDPAVCHGKPVIRGTRVPVAIVLGSLAGGMAYEEVQTNTMFQSRTFARPCRMPPNWSKKSSTINFPPTASGI